MTSELHPVCRFALRRPLSVVSMNSDLPNPPLTETLEFIRGRDYIARIDPSTGNVIADEAVLLDLWTCQGCGEQFPAHDGVEELLGIHTKKHAHGLIKAHQDSK